MIRTICGVLVAIGAVVLGSGYMFAAPEWFIAAASTWLLVAIGALVGVMVHEDYLRRHGIGLPD